MFMRRRQGMKRTAIYARFSTDLQHERSIEDQVYLCRTHAERHGLSVVGVYEDHARSGASVHGREGLLRLLDAVREGGVDVVLVKSLDRLSRDQEDLPGLWKRLSFMGVELCRGSRRQGGLNSDRGARPARLPHLTDLAHKVRRGMHGVIRDGRHAGGKAYGYRPVPGRQGELKIVEEEAAVIRRIFDEYLRGRTPRQIAHGLNADRIAAPRGTSWNASTINGNKTRHYGILQNELYAGVIVWNRVRMVKNPDSGRRISRPNPEQDWQRSEAPHLAIVDKDVFAAAQGRKADRSRVAPERSRKARFLLSGLLKCGCCGGSLVMKDRSAGRVRLHCSRMREAGTCDNRRTFYMDEIEATVLDGLAQHLKDPALLKAFAQGYEDERRRLAKDKLRRRSEIASQLAQLQRSIDRLWGDYESERVPVAIAGPKLKDMQAQKESLEAELRGAARGGSADRSASRRSQTLRRKSAGGDGMPGRRRERRQRRGGGCDPAVGRPRRGYARGKRLLGAA